MRTDGATQEAEIGGTQSFPGQDLSGWQENCVDDVNNAIRGLHVS